jgi:hypothetical protein
VTRKRDDSAERKSVARAAKLEAMHSILLGHLGVNHIADIVMLLRGPLPTWVVVVPPLRGVDAGFEYKVTELTPVRYLVSNEHHRRVERGPYYREPRYLYGDVDVTHEMLCTPDNTILRRISPVGPREHEVALYHSLARAGGSRGW